METRHFTFPNGQVTTLYKHNNGALLMDWETGRLLAKKHYGKDKTITRIAYDERHNVIRSSTMELATEKNKGRILFDIVDGPLSMRGEIDKAGNVVECWKNNIGDAVEKLGPLAKKILKRV